jgi:hypothetical protein
MAPLLLLPRYAGVSSIPQPFIGRIRNHTSATSQLRERLCIPCTTPSPPQDLHLSNFAPLPLLHPHGDFFRIPCCCTHLPVSSMCIPPAILLPVEWEAILRQSPITACLVFTVKSQSTYFAMSHILIRTTCKAPPLPCHIEDPSNRDSDRA